MSKVALGIEVSVVIVLLVVAFARPAAADVSPAFRVLVLAERGGHHGAFVNAAEAWLKRLAAEKGFAVDFVGNTDTIDGASLARYRVFFQLNYPPYAWTPKAAAAFEAYINEGRGGWVGLHHATLLGDFDGYKLWPWFGDFLGGIRFKNYIATFAAGTVKTEDAKHPVMRGVPATFRIAKEEWYTYDKSPRPNVHVLASVDESTYSPASTITMGDHPVVWTNEHVKARNVYIQMGHGPELLENEAYKTMLTNALLWAAGRD